MKGCSKATPNPLCIRPIHMHRVRVCTLISDLMPPAPAPAKPTGGTFSTSSVRAAPAATGSSPSKEEARKESALDGLSVLRRRPAPAPPAPPAPAAPAPARAALVDVDQRGVPGVAGGGTVRGACGSMLPCLASIRSRAVNGLYIGVWCR